MCGISGYSGIKDLEQMNKMVKILNHRGPDAQGIYRDECITLGFNRLSIIDLSSNGLQPMTNEDQSLYLVFNGEIYNFLELKQGLIQKGHFFKSKTDTEVILHGYEEYGEAVVSHLEGMFAFALWDKRQKKLLLARDPMGIKPLYYYWDQKVLAFSSEIKALWVLDVVQNNVSIDESSLPFYLSFQYSPPGKTLFRNIQKIEPAHLLILQEGNLSIKKFEPKSGIKSEDTETFLKESVRSHLMSDAPLGVLLSGGLDSSIITALASAYRPMITFFAGFNQKNDELLYADLVAHHFKTTHHRFFIHPKNVSEVLEKMVWHMDEPLADGGAVATFLIAQYLKDYVKVLLVGEGSDELFGGYLWHKLSQIPLIPKKQLLKGYFYLTTFTSSKRSWYQEVFTQFLDLFDPFQKEKSFFQALSRYELSNVLPNHLLMKVDKMTMAHGIEARVPFLHLPLVTHALSLPDHEKLKGRYGKYILRNIMKDKLPLSILKRKKQGFNLPLKQWLKEDLKPMALDLLLSPNAYILNFMSKKDVETLFVETMGLKEIERLSLLWRLFLLELWHQIFFTFARKV